MRLTKYQDIESVRETATCSIITAGGEIKLTFHALPLTYDIETLRVLPSPAEDAPIDEQREHERISAIKMILDSMEPGEMDFDAILNGDAKAYYLAVIAELESFGLSMAHIQTMLKTVTDLNGMTDVDVEEASADFLPVEG